MNVTFCMKCRHHKPGGTGTGRQYRCADCDAARKGRSRDRMSQKEPGAPHEPIAHRP